MGMIGFLSLCLKTWIGILEDVVTVYSTSEETFPRYSLIIRRLLEILELRWRYTITKLAERYWFITWFGGCLVEWLAEWLGLHRVVRIHKLYLVSYNLALIKPWVWGLNVTFLAGGWPIRCLAVSSSHWQYDYGIVLKGKWCDMTQYGLLQTSTMQSKLYRVKQPKEE